VQRVVELISYEKSQSDYYFATRLDGIEILFADKPEMEGLNLLDVQPVGCKPVGCTGYTWSICR